MVTLTDEYKRHYVTRYSVLQMQEILICGHESKDTTKEQKEQAAEVLGVPPEDLILKLFDLRGISIETYTELLYILCNRFIVDYKIEKTRWREGSEK